MVNFFCINTKLCDNLDIISHMILHIDGSTFLWLKVIAMAEATTMNLDIKHGSHLLLHASSLQIIFLLN